MRLRPRNVRSIRPLRVLLVSTDARFAEDLVAAAGDAGVGVSVVDPAGDLHAKLAEHEADVVVLDTVASVSRAARAGFVLAAEHPRVAIVLAGDGTLQGRVSGLSLVDKWSSPERVLAELERAYLRLAPAVRS